MTSALYFGRVLHRRLHPVPHAFSYSVYMTLLDLAEIDRVFASRWFWSTSRAAPVRFRREDHLGDPSVPLAEAARRFAEDRLGFRPAGRALLLTNLRHFGYVFNPVSFYYLHGADAGGLEAVIAEVANTPWNERHLYALDVRGQAPPDGLFRCEQPKEFHVSPFMDMAATYRFRISPPGESLIVHIDSERDGGPLFEASLTMRRRSISGASLALALARFPLMTAKVTAAIHWQAVRLWMKRIPVVPHPGRSR